MISSAPSKHSADPEKQRLESSPRAKDAIKLASVAPAGAARDPAAPPQRYSSFWSHRAIGGNIFMCPKNK